MKKTTLLNSELSSVIAQMGHLDELTLADAGLPIPSGPKRIDLAVTRGLPAFLPTLDAVFSELKVEAVYIAEECKTMSPDFLNALLELINSQKGEIAIDFISHDEFKSQTKNSRAVVRTGECTPYANIILKSGVAF